MVFLCLSTSKLDLSKLYGENISLRTSNELKKSPFILTYFSLVTRIASPCFEKLLKAEKIKDKKKRNNIDGYY